MSNSLLKVFVLFTLSSISLGLINSPGAQLRISQNALVDAAKSAVERLEQEPQFIQLPEFPETKIINKRFKKVWIHIFNQTAQLVKFDKNSIKVELDNRTTIIKFMFDYVELSVIGKCHVYLREVILPKSRTFNSITNMSLNAEIDFHVFNQNGLPQIQLDSVGIGNYNLTFGFKEKFDDDIFKTIHGKWLEYLAKNNTLKDKLYEYGSTVAQHFNEFILKFPFEYNLTDKLDNLSITYKVVKNISIEQIKFKNELVVPVYSQFWYNGRKKDFPPDVKPLDQFPYYGMPEYNNMCIDIDTNLMLRSAAYAFQISPISNFILKDVDFGVHEPLFSCSCDSVLQQCFTTFFPELTDKCSEGKKILINVTSKVFNLTFDDKGAHFVLAKGRGEFQIYPEEDDDFKQSETLLVIEAFVRIQLDGGNVNVTNWKTYAQIKIFSKNLTATSEFIPQISNETIQRFWDEILQDIATKSANDLIRSGLPLPRAYFTRISNFRHLGKVEKSINLCFKADFDFIKPLPPMFSQNSNKKNHKKPKKITHRRKHHNKTKKVYVPYYIFVYNYN